MNGGWAGRNQNLKENRQVLHLINRKTLNIFYFLIAILYFHISATLVDAKEAPILDWSRKYVYGAWDFFIDADTDDSGNIVVTGPSANPSDYSNYLTIKYDNFGNILWTRFYGGPSSDSPYGVAIDKSGNVIVVGNSGLIKYNAAGDTLWAKTIGKENDYFHGIDTDDTGNIILVGDRNQGSETGCLVTKCNSAGDTIWVRVYKKGDYGEFNGVAVYPNGDFVAAGYSINGSDKDFFTVRYKNNGDTAWARTYNMSDKDIAWDVGIDGNGNVVVVGERWSNSSTQNFLIVKYDSNGNQLWTRTSEEQSQFDSLKVIRSVGIDEIGNIVVSSNIWASLYLLKYDPDGNIIWRRDYEVSGESLEVWGVSIFKNGEFILAGISSMHGLLLKYSLSNYLSSNLYRVPVYPNPFSPDKGTMLKFINLTESSDIKIYSISGECIRTVKYENKSGMAEWDGRNDRGEKVASGVYIYLVANSAGEKATGKIMVIR